MSDSIVVILEGNAGSNANLSVAQSNLDMPIVDVAVASDYYVRGVKHTEWTDIRFKGDLAARAQHIVKGAKLHVTGTLRTEQRAATPTQPKRKVKFVLARKLRFVTDPPLDNTESHVAV